MWIDELDSKLDAAQRKQVLLGHKSKAVSEEQVNFYAKKQFSGLQMEELRKGFENGLSMSQVRLYSCYSYSPARMRQIRLGIQNGLTEVEIATYNKVKYSEAQMKELREACEDRAIEALAVFCTKDEYDYDEVVQTIRDARNADLALCTQIVPLLEKTGTIKSLRMGLVGMSIGLNWEHEVLPYVTCTEFSNEQVMEALIGVAHKLRKSTVKKFFSTKYTAGQMKQIRLGLEHGLAWESSVSKYSKPALTEEEMRRMRERMEGSMMYIEDDEEVELFDELLSKV